MEINKINSTNSIQSNQGVNKAQTVVSKDAVSGKDSMNFSDEIKTRALYQKAVGIVKNTPDIRMDKVEEARKLLESFKNPSDDILEEVAQSILRDFGVFRT